MGKLVVDGARPNTPLEGIDPISTATLSEKKNLSADAYQRVAGGGKVVASGEIPDRIVTLPAGYPAQYDLGAAARGLAEVLLAQGIEPAALVRGATKSVTFCDGDLTIWSAPPLPVTVLDGAGELVRGADQQPIELGMGPDRDWKRDYEALQQERTDIDWSKANIDWEPFNSIANVLAADPILPTIAALKASGKAASSRQLLITARGDKEEVAGAIKDYAAQAELPLDGVLMIYHPEHQKKLGLTDETVGQGRKKALTMAAALHLFDPSLAKVRTVRFIDDNDENLRAAMQLLPQLFPKLRFEFIDVVHLGDGKFEHRLAAKSGKNGELRDSQGKKLDPAAIEAYHSVDAPFGAVPPAVKFWKVSESGGELSNFAEFPINIGGKSWPTTEHYFQAQKFAGTSHEEEVRNAPSPMDAATMGRDKSRPLRKDWEQVKEQIMLQALREKFTQHPALRELLLGTGQARIIENSPKDSYWGDGGNGTGKNRLGELLMQLRAELRLDKASH